MLESEEFEDFRKILWDKRIQRLKHIPCIRELLLRNAKLYDKIYQSLEKEENAT